jgi:hypothetical protein
MQAQASRNAYAREHTLVVCVVVHLQEASLQEWYVAGEDSGITAAANAVGGGGVSEGASEKQYWWLV